MTSTRIVPPAVQAVTLMQAKAHLRISTDDDDAVLSALIEAAIDYLERDVGLALIRQTWRFWFDEIPATLVLPINRKPVSDVVQITVYDSQGMPENLAAADYFLNTVTTPARLRLAADSDWSAVQNGIEVEVQCGFGTTGAEVPNSLRQAVLVLVAHWFEFRGAFDPSDQPVSIPDAYKRLLKPWRRMGL